MNDKEIIVTVEAGIRKELLKNTRELRKCLTDAEKLLWKLLRNRRLNHWKFRRQHPLSAGFILDFYCAETRVAIELDGSYHKDQEKKILDKNRTAEIEKYGIRVIRFWNAEVLDETESVIRRIVEFSSSPPALRATPSPTWRGGKLSHG